jgi:hypothetical protein
MELRYRQDITKLVNNEGIGLELGIAEGVFHERVLQNSNLYMYGIDMYSDRTHTHDEYKRALKRILKHPCRSTILKMRFDEALDLFPDNFFDLIYIDGYAHTGQENGKTLRDWYPKLKSNGIFAGDDYHERWPFVVDVVNKFVKEKNLQLNIVDGKEKVRWCEYPTWYVRKP